MIHRITFTSGSSASAGPLTIDPRPITVLVGPNNSGKSSVLREIEAWCKTGPQQERKVVAEMAVDLPDVEQALAELEPFKRRPGAGEAVREAIKSCPRRLRSGRRCLARNANRCRGITLMAI
jgi:hypothetical protein